MEAQEEVAIEAQEVAREVIGPKLNPECIQAFLEQSLRINDSRRFFKSLIISKQFRAASKYYSIYSLMIESGPGGYKINSSPELLDFDSTRPVSMPFVRLSRFVQLLDPELLSVHFRFVHNIEQQKQLMRISKKKLALKLSGHTQHLFLSVLDEFAARLSHLACDPNLLATNEAIMAKLNLEKYYENGDKGAKSLDRAERLWSKLRAKKVRFNCKRLNPEADIYRSLSDSLDFNTNIRVLCLKFVDSNCSEFLVNLLESIPRRCPKLQELIIIFKQEGQSSTFNPNDLVRRALAYHEKFKELKSKLEDLFSFGLFFTNFCFAQVYNDEWKDMLKENEGLQDALIWSEAHGQSIVHCLGYKERSSQTLRMFEVRVYTERLG